MALIPTLATMAALTLLSNPAFQPESVSINYTPFARFATRIQRAFRNAIGYRRYRRRVRRSILQQDIYSPWDWDEIFYGPGF